MSKQREERSTYLGPWIRIARSLVIFPDSTVSTHAASKFWVKSRNFSLLSSFALVNNNNHVNNRFREKGEWRRGNIRKNKSKSVNTRSPPQALLQIIQNESMPKIKQLSNLKWRVSRETCFVCFLTEVSLLYLWTTVRKYIGLLPQKQ